MKKFYLWSLILGLMGLSPKAMPASVTESAREVPVAATVDVVVVGGSSGAVAAAESAAKAGAKVFLAAPRPYLGEDLAGTLRLWLEPGEKPGSPLARKLFSREGLVANTFDSRSLKFSYQADQPSTERHRDTKIPSRLNDGLIGSILNDSVQFDNDVTITADLGAVKKLKTARMILFHRAGDFSAKSVAIQTRGDGAAWKDLGTIEAVPEGGIATVETPVGDAVRYVRFKAVRAPGAKRLLLAEIALEPDAPPLKRAAADENGPFRPLHIKKTLDAALLDAGVQFFYGCYATDVLRDAQGRLCGIVMANRSGRQAVIAKTVIDASGHGVVARLAGAPFSPFKPGLVTVKWITIAGQACKTSGGKVRKLDMPLELYSNSGQQALPVGRAPEVKGKNKVIKKASWFEYTLKMKLADDTWASRAALEQLVRPYTYDATQLYSPDEPFIIPPVWIKGVKSASAGEAVERLDLDVFRPAGVERLWVLGGCADLPRPLAEKLLRPVALIDAGARVGQAAAAEAKGLAAPEGVRVARAAAGGQSEPGEVKELLAGLRPLPQPTRIAQPAGALPILGRYDVVVIGGGTAGAPAGIAAARKGARTLVVEYLSGLGGVGTLGMIGIYCIGNRVGFTSTVPESPIDQRMDWYRRELRRAGGDIWFNTMGCGALTQGERVTGVVLATPMGRGVVLAKAVVDATGNSDIAIDAGAKYQFVEDHFALQNSHVAPREVGAWYMNGNCQPISDADLLDVRRAFLTRGEGRDKAFDWSQLIDSRERRRIVGDFTLDWLDIFNQRTFPDSIVKSKSNYDSHGYQIHPALILRPQIWRVTSHNQYTPYTPYRCLLPKGVEGILVAGLGMSAHRDAMPIVRMEPDLHNQGYAAGYAAAMAAQGGVTPRQIDVKALQKHLVEIGNLEPRVLTDKDSYPLPVEKLAAAIGTLKNRFEGIELLMAQPKDSLPLLRQAYASAEGPDKVTYAEALGMMGDASGLDTLVKEGQRLMQSADRDTDPQVTAYYTNDLTRLTWALGGTGDRRAVPMLCTIAGEMPRNNAERFRAAAVSLGRIGEPAAAPTLARMLQNLSPARRSSRGSEPDVRELMSTVALYRCGDQGGLAKRKLEQYAIGDNGPWAELAAQVLGGK